MKIIIGITIMILCVVIGYFYSKKYQERKKCFEDLKNFNGRVKNEVNFSQTSLISIVKSISTDTAFNSYVHGYFIDKNDSIDKLKFFNEHERTFVSDYMKNIGQGDKNSQSQFLESSEKQIEKYLDDAIEEDKKYRPLCIKLGFLFGLIILIILL